MKNKLKFMKINIEKEFSNKDFIESYYNFFKNTVEITRNANEILPNAVSNYEKSNKKEIEQLKSTLNDKEKLEYNNFLKEFRKNSSNKPHIIKNKKIVKIFSQGIETSINVNRINMLVREMTLVYLVIEFEQFLERSLRLILNEKPELMKSRKQISYESLFEFKDFNYIKKDLIDNEINAIMRAGIENINQYLIDKFAIDLKVNKNWKEFSERFYRRNILVHNNNIPNKVYILKTGYKGKTDRLNISNYYLRRSFNLFNEYAYAIKNSLINKIT